MRLELPLDLSRSIILVGAGISIDPPSGIPAAAGLLEVLVDWICASAPELRAQLAEALAAPDYREPFEGPYSTTRFELLLEWIRYIEPDIYDALATLDDCGLPNLWHLHVASAIRRGAVVLTTNFDTRLEEACRELQFEPAVAVISSARTSASRLTDANIIKLHGSFPLPGRRCTPIGTLSQISRFGLGYERLRLLVERVGELLEHRALVVCGYSGWDSYDVVPLLESGFRRGGPLLWHTWRPTGKVSVKPPRVFDTLTELHPGDTPAGVFLSDCESSFPGSVWEITGPTSDFFNLLWPAEAAAEARDAFARKTACATPDASAALREELSAPEMALDRDAAEALLGRLAFPYNSDDYKQPRLGGAAETISEIPAEEAWEPDPWQAHVIELLDDGRSLAAADAFAGQIAELERSGNEENPLTYADALIDGLTSACWVALHRFRNYDAWRISRRILREGRQRGLLWAMVLGEYLEANVWIEWATARRGSRTLRHPHEHYRVRAAERLDRAMRYALRIPRLDIFVDACRLRAVVEPDPALRARFEKAVLVWAERLPPCEERLLAYFDLVRWAAGRDGNEALALAAERLGADAAASSSRVAGPYRWAAEAYAALAREDTAGLAAAVHGLTNELQEFPASIRTEWAREIANFTRILNTWKAESA
jgi:hypothetical protein